MVKEFDKASKGKKLPERVKVNADGKTKGFLHQYYNGGRYKKGC